MKKQVTLPRRPLGAFIGRTIGFWILYIIIWEIAFESIGGWLYKSGNLFSLPLALLSSLTYIYFQQIHYINLLAQEILKKANNIDLSRQRLKELKKDLQPENKEQQSSLISHIHRYEDDIAQEKIAYNEAVETYNLATHLWPVRLLRRYQPLDYYSDFYV